MIRKICISICWVIIAICILSILIVIISGGIHLFSIGDSHVCIREIRRPTGFLVSFSVLLLYFKKRDIKAVFIELEKRCTERFALVLLGIFSLLFTWIKIAQHLTFRTGYDFSIFDYAIHNTLKGNFMYVPMLGRNFFSEHFSPILLLLVPLYLIFPGYLVLLVIQALSTVLSGYFIYRLARLEIEKNVIAILILAGYLGSKSLMNGFYFDFHVELFKPLFIIGAFYLFRVRRYLYYWVFVALAIMCKEDVAIYIFGLGLYFWIFERDIRLGLSTCALSLLWIILAWKIVIPLSHPEIKTASHFLSRWSDYGTTYKEISINLVKNPIFLLSRLLSKPSIELLSSVLFLPLLSPIKLMLSIPPLLLNLTSKFEFQASLGGYYRIPIISFLWIAVVYGLKRIHYERLSIVIAFLLCVINFGNYRFYNIDAHVVVGHRMVKMVPIDVPISIQGCFIPHIPYRDDICVFPKVGNAWYILVDTKRSYWPFSNKRDFCKEVNKYLNSRCWEMLEEKDGYILMRKRIYPSKS